MSGILISKDFYQKQNEWSDIYYRSIGESENEKIRFIDSLTLVGGKEILELGCGGGQFALAAARAGYRVTALDIEQNFIQYAQSQNKDFPESRLRFIVADFMQNIALGKFDCICYWDGFGIGDDQQQKTLLKKMIVWLKPKGVILLEVFTPWYWSSVAQGKSWKVSNATRLYEFDPYENRLLDHWWETGKESTRVTQSIRCYAPVDIELLLSDTGFEIKQIKPGGAVDYNTGKYLSDVPLNKAMSYIAVIGAKSLKTD